jgi:adenine-specific DNA-methyltransferase
MNSYRGNRDHKRKLGAYYTSIDIARVLADWAIRDSDNLILEPSFGGCGFLAASKQRLIELGHDGDFSRSVYGCDIDDQAFMYLANCLANTNGNFIRGDFLSLASSDFNTPKVDVILGNPPYVPHHKMPDAQIMNGQRVLQHQGITLHKRASLWAYFVLHSLSFLRDRGRVAWILPSSFLYADYAEEVKKVIQIGFARSLAIQIRDRLFLNEGAKEATVILLCEGWNEYRGTSDIEIAHVSTVLEAQKLIADWDARTWEGRQWSSSANQDLLSESAKDAFLCLSSRPGTKTLGDLCRIRIGIVTGANKFFVLSSEAAQAAGLPVSALQPIVAKYRDYSGLCLREQDILSARGQGKHCLLVTTIGAGNISESLHDYLESFPEAERKQNRTFAKRGVWHQPGDDLVPDAFFPYMTHNGPSLLLNYAGVNSTNTVHRVYFHDGVQDTEKKMVAISILSTFSQLSAEMESRSYGSGVLKHEPSEIRRIKIMIPEDLDTTQVNRVFHDIDALLRNGEEQAAEDIANQYVLQDYPKSQRTQIVTTLQCELDLVRNRRRSHKNGK